MAAAAILKNTLKMYLSQLLINLHEIWCPCRYGQFMCQQWSKMSVFGNSTIWFLVERCSCIASSAIPIRCYLSVTRVYCDKTAEVFTKMQPNALTLCLPSLIPKFKGGPLDGGSNWSGVVFDRVRDAISRKRYEIELRWQLITNRKSYVGFRLQQ